MKFDDKDKRNMEKLNIMKGTSLSTESEIKERIRGTKGISIFSYLNKRQDKKAREEKDKENRAKTKKEEKQDFGKRYESLVESQARNLKEYFDEQKTKEQEER